MGHSLAEDGDLTYRKQDLVRVWREFPSGPSGVFLKSGATSRAGLCGVRRSSDPISPTRTEAFYYGKSFIYPLFAAPFVRLFGTNGFLVLHALLLALVLLCGYLFLHARMSARSRRRCSRRGFVMASVVPVYFVWITPELFNFSLAFLAYFCWLYKEVATPERAPRGTRWLFGGASDAGGGVLLGIATFSKVTNALLFAARCAWLLWQRAMGDDARRSPASRVRRVSPAGLFALNMAISGEWNYQGGDAAPSSGVPVPEADVDVRCRAAEGARRVARRHHLRPRACSGSNLTHNLEYFFVGRHSGTCRVFLSRRSSRSLRSCARRGGGPGGSGSSSRRGAGADAVLHHQPAVHVARRRRLGRQPLLHGRLRRVPVPAAAVRARPAAAVVPWVVGALFTAPLVLNPFVDVVPPGRSREARAAALVAGRADAGQRSADQHRSRRTCCVWFGDNPGQDDPGFQIYFLDDNAYGREPDKSFWVKGESRAEFLIKYRPQSGTIRRQAAEAARAHAQARSATDIATGRPLNGRTPAGRS